MYKKLTILIPVLALILLVSACAKKPATDQNTNQNINANQSPSPSPSPTEIDTSDWKTYRNEEFGFELKYPKEWYSIWENTFSNENIGAPLELSLDGIIVAINVYDNVNKKSLSEWVKDNTIKRKIKVISSEEIDLDGNKYIRTVLGPDGKFNFSDGRSIDSGYYIDTYILYDNKIYSVGAYTYTLESFDKFKKYYDLIVKNLNFKK